MNAATVESVSDRREQLLDKLESLLQRQLEISHKESETSGRKIEALCIEAGKLVEEIQKAGGISSTRFDNRRKKLQSLYSQLRLAVTAHGQSTAAQLSRLRKGKKTIGFYKNNLT